MRVRPGEAWQRTDTLLVGGRQIAGRRHDTETTGCRRRRWFRCLVKAHLVQMLRTVERCRVALRQPFRQSDRFLAQQIARRAQHVRAKGGRAVERVAFEIARDRELGRALRVGGVIAAEGGGFAVAAQRGRTRNRRHRETGGRRRRCCSGGSSG